jgi:hypothetical protein
VRWEGDVDIVNVDSTDLLYLFGLYSRLLLEVRICMEDMRTWGVVRDFSRGHGGLVQGLQSATKDLEYSVRTRNAKVLQIREGSRVERYIE